MDLNELSFDDLDIDAIEVDSVEVVSLKEALALPETGASSGISSSNSCSCCGSSSTCGSCNGGSGGGGGDVTVSAAERIAAPDVGGVDITGVTDMNAVIEVK